MIHHLTDMVQINSLSSTRPFHCEVGMIHLEVRGCCGRTVKVEMPDMNLKTFLPTRTYQMPFRSKSHPTLWSLYQCRYKKSFGNFCLNIMQWNKQNYWNFLFVWNCLNKEQKTNYKLADSNCVSSTLVYIFSFTC